MQPRGNMKAKIARGLIILASCAASYATAQIQYVTLKSGKYSVQTNQIITLVGYDWNRRPIVTGYFPDGTTTTISPYSIFNDGYTHTVSNAGIAHTDPSFYTAPLLAAQIITGLTNILVSGPSATIKIETPTTGSYIPANCVVIPSDATGPVEILLESSADLVNWTSALPGTYGASSTNRFFRVRALANP